MSAGILSKKQVKDDLVKSAGKNPSRIYRLSGKELSDQIGPSAVDLPLGTEYWEMKASCRAGKYLNVRDIINAYASNQAPKHMKGDLTLQKLTVYLFKLDCHLDLSSTETEGKSTARSSIGRLDTLVRLLVDKGERFDRVTAGFEGDLYLEVTPITFDLIVRPGTCLSQLRLFKGGEHLISLTKEALRYEDDFPVVDKDGKPLKEECENSSHEPWYPFCLDLTLDPHANCSGFMAKENPPAPIDPTKEAYYDPKEFWEPVQSKDDAIRLHTNRLYILRSKERLRLPGHMALECQAYTETMGEWRIEYAGFAHPYFGSTRSKGSPLMFEVRGHNIPTLLTNGIQLGNVCFKRMSQKAQKTDDPSQYEHQELKLSTCFKAWPT